MLTNSTVLRKPRLPDGRSENDAAASQGEAAASRTPAGVPLEPDADRQRDHVGGLLVAGGAVGHALHDHVEPTLGVELRLAEAEIEPGAGIEAELGLGIARAQARDCGL